VRVVCGALKTNWSHINRTHATIRILDDAIGDGITSHRPPHANCECLDVAEDFRAAALRLDEAEAAIILPVDDSAFDVHDSIIAFQLERAVLRYAALGPEADAVREVEIDGSRR